MTGRILSILKRGDFWWGLAGMLVLIWSLLLEADTVLSINLYDTYFVISHSSLAFALMLFCLLRALLYLLVYWQRDFPLFLMALDLGLGLIGILLLKSILFPAAALGGLPRRYYTQTEFSSWRLEDYFLLLLLALILGLLTFLLGLFWAKKSR